MIRILLGRLLQIIGFTPSFAQGIVVPGMCMRWFERGPCGLVLLSVQPGELYLDGGRDLVLTHLQVRLMVLLRHIPLPDGLNAS